MLTPSLEVTMTSARVRPFVLALLLTVTTAAVAAAQTPSGTSPPAAGGRPTLTMARAVETALAAAGAARAAL